MQNRFNSIIKAAVHEQLPEGFDWRLIKAQLFVALNLNESAKSSVGALGIAQFMPDRWQIIKDDMGLPEHASCEQAEYAIPGLCFYMGQMLDYWTAEREWIDHYCLALASYHCGLLDVMNARQDAVEANDYASIIARLPKVIDLSDAKKTKDYVRKVLKVLIGLVLDK